MSIDFYKEFGELGYLANYSSYGFTVDGIYYPTVEHYYQASKFTDPSLIQKILACKSPKEASVIGRDPKNQRIPHFKEIKNQKMEEGIYYKFQQNKDIRCRLLETRNQEIREMSVKESYWGVGPNQDGENVIGKILMKVRSRLLQEVKNEIISRAKEESAVYVIGHAKADADSFLSAYLLTRILKSYGVNAIFAVRDEEFVDSNLIKDFCQEDYSVVSSYDDKKIILVDHNDLQGIPKENVIGAFDHHRITYEVLDLIEAEYASSGLLLYDLFRSDYPFSEKEKDLIALTVLADTEYLTSSRFSDTDKKLYEELQSSLDSKELQKKYLKTISFRREIYENFHEDYKEYPFQNGVIHRSIIKSYTKECQEFLPAYLSSMKDCGIDLIIWCDYEAQKTYVCYQDEVIPFPIFTTSTMLVLDYLEHGRDEKHLIK